MKTKVLSMTLVCFLALASFSKGAETEQKNEVKKELNDLCFKYCENGRYIWHCPPNWEPVDMGPCP